MGKAPSFQFFPNDWMHDLDEHPLEIEGAWIRVCCKLWWSETRGRMDRTLDQWARIFRTDNEHALKILVYLRDEKIAEIPTVLTLVNTNNSGAIHEYLTPAHKNITDKITVISRRMLREEKARQNNCLRQKRHYDKRKPNADSTERVTVPSSYSSSSSSEIQKKSTPLISPHSGGKARAKKSFSDEFEAFWKSYPRKVGKGAAWKAWGKLNGTRPPLAVILDAVNLQAASRQWQDDGGRFIPHPATWLNQNRWLDEIETGPDEDENDRAVREWLRKGES